MTQTQALPLIRRLSFNQATARYWPLPDAVAGCVAAGVTNIGLWREPVAEYGIEATAALVRDAGLTVTSLCRGGFFTSDDWYDDNRRAVDEAAALGTSVVVLVCGGLLAHPRTAGAEDIDAARERVADAVGRLVPHAAASGVTLAIEALHPMFASDRSVIVSLGQALDIAERFPAGTVGVAVDTYHIWWDDQVYAQIARAAGRIAVFQIADWATPLPLGALTGRAMPGAGCVPQVRLLAAVTAAGYTGPIEVEVFNEDLWARPGEEILRTTVDAYRGCYQIERS
jgi:sugar phosphate isomerase/epimerase